MRLHPDVLSSWTPEAIRLALQAYNGEPECGGTARDWAHDLSGDGLSKPDDVLIVARVRSQLERLCREGTWYWAYEHGVRRLVRHYWPHTRSP